MPTVKYYIVATAEKDKKAHVTLVQAFTKGEAHRLCADAYRRDRDLGPQIHLNSYTLEEFTSQSAAYIFYARLIEEIEKQQHESTGDDQTSNAAGQE